MREYETVVITKPELAESEFNQIHERIKGTIEKQEGRLFYARDMGSRKLAYPISKQTKGVYTCYDYATAGGAVSELERNMCLNDNVLRFLTVIKNEEVDVEARAAEIVARGEDVSPQAEAKVEANAETRSETKAEAKPKEKTDEAKEPGKEE